MVYVNFMLHNRDSAYFYFIECDNKNEAYHVIDCMRYCDEIKKVSRDGDYVLFSHFKITNTPKKHIDNAGNYYRESIKRWAKQGFIG